MFLGMTCSSRLAWNVRTSTIEGQHPTKFSGARQSRRHGTKENGIDQLEVLAQNSGRMNVIHVACPRLDLADADIVRVSLAQSSWEALYARGVRRFHVDERALGRVFEDGAHRGLVYLKDILEAATAASGEGDLVYYTNDDVLLHPGIVPVLKQAAEPGFAHAYRCCLKYGREWWSILDCNICDADEASGTRNEMPLTPSLSPSSEEALPQKDGERVSGSCVATNPDVEGRLSRTSLRTGPRVNQPSGAWRVGSGRDLFAFKGDILREVLCCIPDFVVGAYCWDWFLVLLCHVLAGKPVDGEMARRVKNRTGYSLKESWLSSRLTGLIPAGYVFHIDHEPLWERAENVNELPSQKHNLERARQGLLALGVVE